MKKNIYIILFLLIGLPSMLISQNLSNAQRRYMMMDLLELVENYEKYSSLKDTEVSSLYLDLFENDNLIIYNDLLGLSNAENLSVNEYVNLLKNKGSRIWIKNITIREVYKSTDKWMARISFNKENLYTGECENVTFSSFEYYKTDHQIELVAAWDSKNRTCKIASLTGYINSDAEKLPENYMVFKKNHPNDSLLLCNGKNIRFDSRDQAFFARDVKFSYPTDLDMKLFLIDDTLGCNIVTMDYRPTRWRLRPHVDILLGEAFNIETVNDEAIQTASSSLGWGVDLGYVYPTEKKVRWGLFFGVGFQKSEFSLNIPNMGYSYSAGSHADVDGDRYTRYYSLSNTRYRTELNEIYIPFYWDMDWRFNNYISMYADFGLKAYASFAKEKVYFETNYTTYGVYPQYGNLLIDAGTLGVENSINGFVDNAHVVHENVNNDILSDYTLDGFVGLGIRGRMYKDWYLDLGLYYQTNLYENYNCKGDVAVLQNSSTLTTRKVPMSYLTHQGERIENITGYISSMRRSALNLNLGIMWKF